MESIMRQPDASQPLHPEGKYLHSREHFRVVARSKFFENPSIKPLIGTLNEYVAATTFLMSGKDWRQIPNGPYIADLIVSFVRTHFISIDLTVQCEIIEATILVRKQFELLARLNELQNAGSVESLLKRTPNLSALQTNIKTLYGSYSEIAHSASPGPLELLGSVKSSEGYMTAVYPVFTENSHACLNHIALCVFEYFLWANTFLMCQFGEYEKTWETQWMPRAINAYIAIWPS